jgi:hypothetical protein
MTKQIIISDRQASLRDKVLMLKEKKNLTGAELSRITGRSEGTISDLLGNKKSFSDKLIAVVYESLRDYLGDNDLVATRQYAMMWNIAKTGKQASDMRLVTGNTGVGKSVVFKKFAEETPCCVYYKIYDRGLSWNNLLNEVCRGFAIKMPIDRKRYRRAELLGAIISYVEQNADQNPMLIVDESEVMRNAFFKEFKNLQTATDGLLSIVIVGISEVTTRVAKIAGLDPQTWLPIHDDSNQYTTFARRIKSFRIPNISTCDIRDFCIAKGIENNKVIEEASKTWWNYGAAQTAIDRAERMGISLKEITIDEFRVL